MLTRTGWKTPAAIVVVVLAWASVAAAMAPESKRLTRARDYIADEQWAPAIEQLRAAVDDPKEPRRDEALYWLAHSQHHSGDPGAAVQTIGRLERDFPKSMWVKPGQALRIEIAVKLQRADVLWWTAVHKPAVPAPAMPPRAINQMPPKAVPPRPAGAPPGPEKPAKGAPPVAVPPPPAIWQVMSPDDDLRIQALVGLMRSQDAEKAVPILEQIAFESAKPGPATRAVFALAQSPLPRARETVMRVAKADTAPESVRVAAVTYFGRFGGPDVSGQLLDVYLVATEPVKVQIVKSLGERSEKTALLDIVNREKNMKLRSSALVMLGRVGAADSLVSRYKTEGFEGKRSIISGLFFARAEAELIRIADSEQTAGNDVLSQDALDRLRLLGTPKAREYLLKVSEKR